MSILKKIGAPLAAVALVAVMGVSLLFSSSTVSAAAAIANAPTATVNLTTNAVNGSQAFTALTMRLDCPATTDCPNSAVLQLTAPTGWEFPSTGVTGAVVATAAADLAAPRGAAGTVTYGTSGASVTITLAANGVATVAGDDFLVLGLTIRPKTNSSATGNITFGASTTAIIGTSGATVGTITAGTAITAPYTLVLTAPQASVPADGSQATTVTALLRDTNSAVVSNTPVMWTVSLGILGTGTSKTATSITGTAGTTTQSYRGGGGVAATDTVIGTVSSLNVVGTLAMPLVTATGTTASKIVINAPVQLAVAATVTNTSPGYFSGRTGTDLSLKVTDAAGLGVNGQVVLVTADKGFVMNGHGVACPGTTKAVSPTTATLAPTVGATVESGIIQLTFCGNQLDAAGKATLTAQNITTSMANATQTISMAGRPSKVEATVTGNAITASVMDAGGNAVADGTPIRFTISANAGAVSTACTTSSNGKASTVVALIAASGTVIVSSDFNETTSAATCAAAGTQQVAASVVVGAGGGVVTPPAPGAGTGAGGFASAPVYSASKLAQAVFNGGTVAQLETAVTAGNGTGVWAQDSKGVFVLYIVNGGFVNDAFKAAFPTGFSGVTAVTVVGK